jgi:hypothetical protein
MEAVKKRVVCFVPRCKSVVQAKEHVGALGWRLDQNEGELPRS